MRVHAESEFTFDLARNVPERTAMHNFRIFFEECGMDGLAEVKAKTVYDAIEVFYAERPSANIVDVELRLGNNWIVGMLHLA